MSRLIPAPESWEGIWERAREDGMEEDDSCSFSRDIGIGEGEGGCVSSLGCGDGYPQTC